MDEVAAIAKAAVALLREGVASLGLVGSIVLHVNPQVLRPVGELALAAVRTAPPLHEIFAQRAFGLVCGVSCGGGVGGEGQGLMSKLHFFAVGGGF